MAPLMSFFLACATVWIMPDLPCAGHILIRMNPESYAYCTHVVVDSGQQKFITTSVAVTYISEWSVGR